MTAARMTPQEVSSRILYEDESILVFHKPAGLAVQTKSVMQQDLETLLLTYRKGKYLGTIHRLDQPVEGILVFGLDKPSTAALAAQTSGHQMTKRYLAVVAPKENAPALDPSDPTSRELTDYLAREAGNYSRVVAEGTPGAKKSRLSYQVLSRCHDEGLDADLYLLSVLLGTGRHHQIRVQLSHAGLPLLGDTRYGGPSYDGLGLCCVSLTLVHPKDHKQMSFSITPQGSPFVPFLPL